MNDCTISGKYCKINYQKSTDLDNKVFKVIQYFDSNYLRIIDILKPDYNFYNNVEIEFVDENIEANYSHGKIKINPGKLEESNLGLLIHEGAHAVQNYPGTIGKIHPFWWLLEGIADYCRAKLENNFVISKGKPENGYREAAHFLIWLACKYGEGVIQRINKALHFFSESEVNVDSVFNEALRKNYKELYCEYIAV